jgi:hypothetical protein
LISFQSLARLKVEEERVVQQVVQIHFRALDKKSLGNMPVLVELGGIALAIELPNPDLDAPALDLRVLGGCCSAQEKEQSRKREAKRHIYIVSDPSKKIPAHSDLLHRSCGKNEIRIVCRFAALVLLVTVGAGLRRGGSSRESGSGNWCSRG